MTLRQLLSSSRRLLSELRSADILEIVRQSKNLEIVNRQAQELREKRRLLSQIRRPVEYMPMPLQLVLFQEMPKHRLAFPTSSSAPDTAIAWPPADQRTTGSASGFPETQPSQRSYGPLSILQNGASTVPAWTTSLAQSMSSFSPSHSSKTKEEPYSSTTLLQCTCDYNIVINKSGEYVVMSGQQGSYTGTAKHEFKDITLADFRHALGWFSTYFDDTVRETSSGGSSVLAVQASSPFKQNSSG
ncbi:hypothetical protein KXW35_004353 [Aspergillus fumigatus]|nr:hypothetical protein KXW35_004353 [Aspergillus fumigatus]